VKDLTLLLFSPLFSKTFLFSLFLFKLLDFITLFSVSRRFCTVYKLENYVPCQPFGRRDILSGRPTAQSIIRPDDENFPSGPSSVSRSFELFQLALVRTFQQHVWTPLGVQPAMEFPSKTQL
jgi:hypothetical protein